MPAAMEDPAAAAALMSDRLFFFDSVPLDEEELKQGLLAASKGSTKKFSLSRLGEGLEGVEGAALGEGAFGMVCRVKLGVRGVQSIGACKMFTGGRLEDAQREAAREADVLYRARGHDVFPRPTAYYTGSAECPPCIIYELFSLGSLDTVFSSHPKLLRTPLSLIYVGKELTRLTMRISALGVIHRDLKLDNVLLHSTSSSSDHTTCRLGDAGLGADWRETLDQSNLVGNNLAQPAEIYEEGRLAHTSDLPGLSFIIFSLFTNANVGTFPKTYINLRVVIFDALAKTDMHNLLYSEQAAERGFKTNNFVHRVMYWVVLFATAVMFGPGPNDRSTPEAHYHVFHHLYEAAAADAEKDEEAIKRQLLLHLLSRLVTSKMLALAPPAVRTNFLEIYRVQVMGLKVAMSGASTRPLRKQEDSSLDLAEILPLEEVESIVAELNSDLSQLGVSAAYRDVHQAGHANDAAPLITSLTLYDKFLSSSSGQACRDGLVNTAAGRAVEAFQEGASRVSDLPGPLAAAVNAAGGFVTTYATKQPLKLAVGSSYHSEDHDLHTTAQVKLLQDTINEFRPSPAYLEMLAPTADGSLLSELQAAAIPIAASAACSAEAPRLAAYCLLALAAEQQGGQGGGGGVAAAGQQQHTQLGAAMAPLAAMLHAAQQVGEVLPACEAWLERQRQQQQLGEEEVAALWVALQRQRAFIAARQQDAADAVLWALDELAGYMSRVSGLRLVAEAARGAAEGLEEAEVRGLVAQRLCAEGSVRLPAAMAEKQRAALRAVASGGEAEPLAPVLELAVAPEPAAVPVLGSLGAAATATEVIDLTGEGEQEAVVAGAAQQQAALPPRQPLSPLNCPEPSPSTGKHAAEPAPAAVQQQVPQQQQEEGAAAEGGSSVPAAEDLPLAGPASVFSAGAGSSGLRKSTRTRMPSRVVRELQGPAAAVQRPSPLGPPSFGLTSRLAKLKLVPQMPGTAAAPVVPPPVLQQGRRLPIFRQLERGVAAEPAVLQIGERRGRLPIFQQLERGVAPDPAVPQVGERRGRGEFAEQGGSTGGTATAAAGAPCAAASTACGASLPSASSRKSSRTASRTFASQLTEDDKVEVHCMEGPVSMATMFWSAPFGPEQLSEPLVNVRGVENGTMALRMTGCSNMPLHRTYPTVLFRDRVVTWFDSAEEVTLRRLSKQAAAVKFALSQDVEPAAFEALIKVKKYRPWLLEFSLAGTLVDPELAAGAGSLRFARIKANERATWQLCKVCYPLFGHAQMQQGGEGQAAVAVPAPVQGDGWEESRVRAYRWRLMQQIKQHASADSTTRYGVYTLGSELCRSITFRLNAEFCGSMGLQGNGQWYTITL